MRDLSLHLLDIIQNSITAKADKLEVKLEASTESGMLEITIADNGTGMDAALLARVTDPFSTTRTTRKVGLGIPLFKAAAERSGGMLCIESAIGEGTKLKASFGIENIDRPPLGDIADTISGVILANADVEIDLKLVCNENAFGMNTAEIKEKLGEVPITEFEVLTWIEEYVNEGITAIFGGVLNEIDSSTGRDKEEDA